MTLTEAMAYKFLVREGGPDGQVVQRAGRGMRNDHLKHYADSGKGQQKAAAAVLLAESFETEANGAVIRQQNQQPAPAQRPQAFGTGRAVAQTPPAAPAAAPWEADETQDEHGVGQKEVTEVQPEWAKRLESKFDKLIMLADALASRPATQPTAPAAGVGQGASNGGGQFITETIEASKHKGRLSFKVKGGRYSNFGVTVWPEVMAAHGFKESDYPIGEEVKFPGHTAIFTFKEATEEGKPPNPDKIVRFIRCDK